MGMGGLRLRAQMTLAVFWVSKSSITWDPLPCLGIQRLWVAITARESSESELSLGLCPVDILHCGAGSGSLVLICPEDIHRVTPNMKTTVSRSVMSNYCIVSGLIRARPVVAHSRPTADQVSDCGGSSS